MHLDCHHQRIVHSDQECYTYSKLLDSEYFIIALIAICKKRHRLNTSMIIFLINKLQRDKKFQVNFFNFF